jgi:integrase
MSSILVRKRRDGSLAWQVQIRIQGHGSVSKTFNNETDAKFFSKQADKNVIPLKNQEYIPTPHLFFQKKFIDIMHEFAGREKTSHWHKRCFACVVKHVGNATMREVRHQWAEDYIERLSKMHSASTRLYTPSALSKHLTFMSAAYRWAARDHDLTMPTDLFSFNLLPRNWKICRDRRLDRSEWIALIHQFKNTKSKGGPYWRVLMHLALETGARLQELLLAEWSEFNFKEYVWRIPKLHTKSKTERVVPLSYTACRLLAILAKLKKTGATRIFHQLNDAASVSTSFSKWIKKAEITNFRFHDLRHEAISRMIIRRREMHTFEIMRIVGHSTLTMLNRYANLRPQELVARFRTPYRRKPNDTPPIGSTHMTR